MRLGEQERDPLLYLNSTLNHFLEIYISYIWDLLVINNVIKSTAFLVSGGYT